MAMLNGAAMATGQGESAPPPVKPGGIEDLVQYIDHSKSECLNESDDHPYKHCLTSGGGYLASDCDEQLILSLSFNQVVKVQSIKIKAPSTSGPKTIRIFKNLPNSLDFTGAESMVSIQDLVLTSKQLNGEDAIPLKFVKFQNVQNIQFFFSDNQGEEEVTQIDYFALFGMPLATTNMKELKKAG